MAAWGLSTAPLQLSALPAPAAASATSAVSTTSPEPPADAAAYVSMPSAPLAPSSSSGLSGAIPRDRYAASALGLCEYLGLLLKQDVRALLFWERFFVLYFRQAELTPQVGCPLPLPSRSQLGPSPPAFSSTALPSPPALSPPRPTIQVLPRPRRAHRSLLIASQSCMIA